MIYILDLTDPSKYNNFWYYTFIGVALFCILIGAAITLMKIFGKQKYFEKKLEEDLHNEEVFDDPEVLLKKR